MIGLDYLSISKGGIIQIYDDSIESIAKEALKIITNSHLRSSLGYEARTSMKQFKNEILLKNGLN